MALQLPEVIWTKKELTDTQNQLALCFSDNQSVLPKRCHGENQAVKNLVFSTVYDV
ncbi:MAG: hypothetical protein FWD25_13080 [Clostridia bacterium]|nr:hypothetical protein [Clostridia bacterium]